MQEIISLIEILASIVISSAANKLLDRVINKQMKKQDLYYGYALIASVVLLVSLILLRSWYCLVAEYGAEYGYTFFPTWPERTPLEWYTSAVLIILMVIVYLCALFNNVYNSELDAGYIGSERFKKKWRNLMLFFFGIGALVYIYQAIEYGWRFWQWGSF